MTPVVETLADDDPDHWDEGRDDLPCDTDINAVDIHFPVSSTLADVFSDEPAPFQSDVVNEPDTICAQLDSGAFALCTDQLHMLHDYTKFSAKNPCPVTNASQ